MVPTIDALSRCDKRGSHEEKHGSFRRKYGARGPYSRSRAAIRHVRAHDSAIDRIASITLSPRWENSAGEGRIARKISRITGKRCVVMKPRSRPSDRLGTPATLSATYMEWASLAIDLWKSDPNIPTEFVDVVSFFDFAQETAQALIESAYKK
jgi:hypothetical protein